MGHGQPVVWIREDAPPLTDNASQSLRSGLSMPNEGWPTIDFDDTDDEYFDWLAFLHPTYSQRGLTFHFAVSAKIAVTGNMRFEIGIRAVAPAENPSLPHTYVYTAVTVAAPTPLGAVVYVEVPIVHGTPMDNWNAEEWAMIRFRRRPTAIPDTMSGDAELLGSLVVLES